MAERGARRHLLGQAQRDLAPAPRLLAAGWHRAVSLGVWGVLLGCPFGVWGVTVGVWGDLVCWDLDDAT